ncbi:hypothetical protein EV193_112119 [Herbihabitans rhizosphaerae]|uniref:Uncharacterized protein n=1 Tax=Herbihabitans rhizosphaerae TaxID=1872711 RepID=A0A4Q7KE22_9PSEU|nr:hypothetical protein [Herbihabitans rhizosphaerae]RZS32485.1 hypothetical protein EV193_112119 [Herbihabitans rhizosphaerae]
MTGRDETAESPVIRIEIRITGNLRSVRVRRLEAAEVDTTDPAELVSRIAAVLPEFHTVDWHTDYPADPATNAENRFEYMSRSQQRNVLDGLARYEGEWRVTAVESVTFGGDSWEEVFQAAGEWFSDNREVNTVVGVSMDYDTPPHRDMTVFFVYGG